MIRKKIIPKINSDMSWKLPQLVRNLFVFLCAVICLVTFSVVADEEPNTKKKDGEVVQQSEEKPADSVKSAENKNAKKDANTPSSNSDGATTEPTKEVITGTADKMERDQKAGITILIGEINQAKTVRLNEQGVEIGFLNADRITLKTDPETGQTTEIIAVGNVEIRDQDIFATCDNATMNNLTNIITLKDNVVVLQNKDRLETKLFTFNRTTGKQTGEGNVKFKVTVTQATPTATPEESEEAGSESKDTSATTDKTDEKAASEKTKKETENKSDSEKTDNEEKNTPSETEKGEKDSESKKDKETEPVESEETKPTESEETDEAEGSEETE